MSLTPPCISVLFCLASRDFQALSGSVQWLWNVNHALMASVSITFTNSFPFPSPSHKKLPRTLCPSRPHSLCQAGFWHHASQMATPKPSPPLWLPTVAFIRASGLASPRETNTVFQKSTLNLTLLPKPPPFLHVGDSGKRHPVKWPGNPSWLFWRWAGWGMEVERDTHTAWNQWPPTSGGWASRALLWGLCLWRKPSPALLGEMSWLLDVG